MANSPRHDPVHSDDDPSGFGASIPRRRVLTAGSALVLATASGLISPTPLFADPSAEAIADFDNLSRFLTGHTTLDATLAGRILSLLQVADEAFPQKLSDLQKFIADQRVAPAGLQAALDSAKSPLAPLPRLILRAWYLGVVGEGNAAVCVTYTDALMNCAVADVLRPPSYAYGAYGSWAVRPV